MLPLITAPIINNIPLIFLFLDALNIPIAPKIIEMIPNMNRDKNNTVKIAAAVSA